MSKSMLIIDTPESCKTCDIKFTDDYADWCPHKKAKSDVYDYIQSNSRPDWCPLSPLPEKIKLKQYVDNAARNMNSVMAYAYAQGRNDCLDEILEGEK